MASADKFVVRDVRELDAYSDLYVCLPVTREADSGKITYHRLALRSRPTTVPADAGNAIQFSTRLKRFALKFSSVWVSHIRAFGENGDGAAGEGGGSESAEQQKVTMGIALSDGRQGPTEEESDIISRLDHTTKFLRRQMVLKTDIRTTLNIAGGGKKDISMEQVDMYADTLDSINISKPLQGSADINAETGRYPTRYIYPKVVLDGFYRTLLFTPDRKPIPIALARSWGSGCQAPVVMVELESIFCNKLIKSLQMRVLEAILVPPDVQARSQVRTSLIFPDVPCGGADEEQPQLQLLPMAPSVELHSPNNSIVDQSETPPTTSVEEPPIPFTTLTAATSESLDLPKQGNHHKKKRKRVLQ